MESFNKIYKQYYNMMYRVAFKMLGSDDAVSDIVQEVFISLFQKMSVNKEVKHYSSWLYRATYNQCIDYIKIHSKRNGLDLLSDVALDDGEIDKEEARRLVNKALGNLKSDERFLAVLYSEGLSYKEIAEAANLNVNSVGKMLSRVLRKMAKELKEEYYELF